MRVEEVMRLNVITLVLIGMGVCHGKVKEFKAHARYGFVSVIVEHESDEEVSELNYPHMQIYKETS